MDFSIHNPPPAVRKVETYLKVDDYDSVKLEDFITSKRMTLSVRGVIAVHLACNYDGYPAFNEVMVKFEDDEGNDLGHSVEVAFDNSKEEFLLMLPKDTQALVFTMTGASGNSSNPDIKSRFYMV